MTAVDQTVQSNQAPQTTQATELRRFVTDGLIIALTVFVGYLWTLCFEIGICDYFWIPVFFISLSQVNVLFMATPLFISLIIFCGLFATLLYLSYWLGNTIDRYISRSPTYEIYAKIISVVALAVVYAAILSSLVEGFGQTVTKITLGVVLLAMVIVIFVIPLFTHHREGSYWDKLVADTSQRRHNRAPLRSVFSPRLRDIYAVGLLLFFVAGVVYTNFIGGRTYAGNIALFQVIAAENLRPEVIAIENPRPEVVVLRIYGDYLLTAPFDRSTKEFKKKLYILEISEMAEIPLTFENVGPLKVKPDSSPQATP